MTGPRRHGRAAAGIAMLGMANLAIGCERAKTSDDTPAVSSTASVDSRVEPRDSTARAKAYAATEPGRLGTLPDGVGLVVGSEIPHVVLRDSCDQPIDLANLVPQGPLAIVFYRGGWCPYCNFQVRDLVRAFDGFRQRGVTPVAVSVDRVSEASTTSSTHEVPFPLLSDPDLKAHESFRIIHRASEAEVTRLSGFGIDLERSSGRKHHAFAIPSIFIVDRKGKVRWAHADPSYKIRPTSAQLLAVLDEMKLEPRSSEPIPPSIPRCGPTTTDGGAP